MKRAFALVIGASLVAAGAVGAPVAAAPAAGAADSGLRSYVVPSSPEVFRQMAELGMDRDELGTSRAADGSLVVNAVLSQAQAGKLRAGGLDVQRKQVDAQAAARAQAATAAARPVFRPYSGAGGLREELEQVARDNPGLVKRVEIGHSVQGQPIVALKVTKGARTETDGSRPATLYASAQHAREWITPEMTRRLLHHYLDGYGRDRTITSLVDTTELWFVPVANPDGYDYTFTAGNRLWRKNLHDNDGNGKITGVDGVDPNRNFQNKWGYDNEGSSPSWSSETYRGTSPASEPETKAMDGLLAKVDFSFLVNYHSAAELLLYGVGWQVATPTPDDVIYEALAGTDKNSAIPGYDPDISAELYTTNGDTDAQAHATRGTLAFTPEMSTCQTASAVDPNDAFEPDACDSVFNFPDSEPLIQAEFEKNLPFALSVATSAVDPAHPVTATGLQAPDFVVDSFPVSYGSPQSVAVTARRSLADLQLRYSIDGGATRTAAVSQWQGGERYGGEQDVYYAEFRGKVVGAKAGDHVEAWFTAAGGKQSEHFTYRQEAVDPPPVLIVADEDIDGVNPNYPASQTEPKYGGRYRDALAANGIASTIFNADNGAPHDLGVLDHFKAVVWYMGDNRLTQDREDEITQFGSQHLPDIAVAQREQYVTLAMRDYLNAGGKLMHSGETAGYFGLLGADLGGIYYGLNGAPGKKCAVTAATSDCLILSDDFTQYYLGAYGRTVTPSPLGITGTDRPVAGQAYTFGSPTEVAAVRDNPLNEAGAFSVTSQLLPAKDFPQFLSWGSSRYDGSSAGALDPVEGDWYAAAVHQDSSYMRLARTVDLTGTAAGADPQLRFQLSYDTEQGYDNVIVEAHPVGSQSWTTLPDANGGTDQGLPAECSAGFLLAQHPFLKHYLTPGNPCKATGTTGAWNRFTGNSGGWQQVAVDLSAYAGKQVEVSVTYVTDPSAGGKGVFVDDTRLATRAGTTGAEGFETGLGPWRIGAAPAGSAPNLGNFQRTQVVFAPTITTPDTVLDGFGFEHLSRRGGAANDYIGRVMGQLLGRPAP